MVVYKADMVQRALHYAIVDEVDSILVDEARTPLIISGAGDKSTDMYTTANKFVLRLERGPDVEKLSRVEMFERAQEEEKGDYVVDEKAKTVALTSHGQKKAEEFFGVGSLADVENMALNHHIIQALKANATMKRDRDYVVQNGEVLIVDEFTGRLMIGRRYSDGLHQAIEAKEGVKVEREDRTLATITFQNYFRMYSKLSGMTGTAKTEEQEFQDIYSLNVIEIPTYKPMIRKDYNDVVYMTEEGKFRAVVEEIAGLHASGQPVLVGTVSVEKSEYLSKLLKQRGIKHEVLNAKLHAKEAEIVAQAGKLGTVTIATNMAGRGTDILLGGNPDFLTRRQMRALGYEDEIIEEATGHADTDDEIILDARAKYNALFTDFKRETDAEHDQVVALGGLAIIATERHESRRIDNQLRGRSGRQGDPGSSKFFISLEDDLMRLFGSERVKGMVSRLSPNDDIPMDIGILSKQIEGAQKRVEGHNFDIRKHVLQYDDVMNKQRGIIYEQRRRVLLGEDIHQSIMDMLHSLISDSIDKYCHPHTPEAEWDINGLLVYLKSLPLPVELDVEGRHSREELLEWVTDAADKAYEAKEAEIHDEGADMRELERVVLLRTVDTKWIDHIDAMDQLRQGIGLRAYGQRDPVLEYRKEGFDMFDDMVQSIREDTITMILRMKINRVPAKREQISKPIEPVGESGPRPKRTDNKPGRNSPCPCGSGKKYKNCCGKDE
jgi:preprotein translocase subunit SecA